MIQLNIYLEHLGKKDQTVAAKLFKKNKRISVLHIFTELLALLDPVRRQSR